MLTSFITLACFFGGVWVWRLCQFVLLGYSRHMGCLIYYGRRSTLRRMGVPVL